MLLWLRERREYFRRDIVVVVVVVVRVSSFIYVDYKDPAMLDLAQWDNRRG